MINFKEYDYLDTQTEVTVIADSVSSITDHRVTTMLIRLPRFLLPQMNTHRKFNRNVGSSRAKRFSVTSEDMTYEPIIWLENHKGMVSEGIVPEWKANIARGIWRSAGFFAYSHGWLLDKLNISKQYSNRMIEPYCYTDYLVTSTEWDNFLNQRDDPHAQYEIQIVARRLRQALRNSIPKKLNYGEWHLPFISDEEKTKYPIGDLLKVSSARCARTSYSVESYESSFKKNMELYDNRLVNVTPPHLSPTEHQCGCFYTAMSGNIDGFLQYRKVIEWMKLALVDLSYVEENDFDMFQYDPAITDEHMERIEEKLKEININ